MFQKGGETSCPPTLCIGRGVVVMVTYSDLIQIGILTVAIISLFFQVNNKKK